MAKYYGKIGYEILTEVRPSVFLPGWQERDAVGDVINLSRRFDLGSNVNGEMTVSSTISIIADPFAINHFQDIRYVVYMGAKWKVSNVAIEYPRLNLTLGGVYNGDSGPKVGA